MHGQYMNVYNTPERLLTLDTRAHTGLIDITHSIYTVLLCTNVLHQIIYNMIVLLVQLLNNIIRCICTLNHKNTL